MTDTSKDGTGVDTKTADDAPKTDYVITGEETEIEKSERLETETKANEIKEAEKLEQSEDDDDSDDDSDDEDADGDELENDDDGEDDDGEGENLDADDDGEDEEDQESDEDEADKGKRKRRGGFQKKIDKLNTVIEELQDQLSNKSYGREVDPLAPEPERTTFRSDRDFDEAHMDWRLDQREAVLQTEAKKEDFKQSQTVKLSRYEAKTEKLRKNTDYAKVIDSYNGPVSIGMQQALIDSEYGPEVALEIAKSPDLGERMARMSVTNLNRHIGRLEARVEDRKASKAKKSVKSKSKSKKKSSAPSPIKPVKEASNTLVDKDNMSYEDSLKARQRRRGK